MIKVLFAGEGGQGVQAAAEILALAAFNEGKKALYIPNFGVEQRGGVSLAFVVIDEKAVVYPKFAQADILAVLSDRSLPRIKPYQGKQTKTILGPACGGGIKSDLPAKTGNILVLGEVNRLGKIVKSESLIAAMEKRFARQFEKDPSLRQLDLKALKE